MTQPDTNIRKDKRTPCPTCKAKTERQAETMCQPHAGFDGEADCIGQWMRTDGHGYFINNHEPTQEELDSL